MIRCALALLLLCTLPLTAIAAGEDLVNCRWPNGEAIKLAVCTGLRQAAAKDADQAARNAASLKRAEAADAAQLAQHKADQAARTEQARQAAEADRYWAQDGVAKVNADVAAVAREERRQDTTRRKVCGQDYGKPSVGMSLARAQSCVGDLQLVSQVNRLDGVASVYRAGRLQVVAMGGKIVAWDRF